MISGIYVITCKPNGKQYVGSSCDIGTRWNQHRSYLSAGKHANSYLQRAWNKYGQDAFVFQILEECSPDVLIRRELFWVEKVHPELNLMPPSPAREGFTHSLETRRKLSTANKGKTHSAEARRKISDALKLRSTPSAETRKKLSESNKAFTARHPQSEEARQKISKAGKGRTVTSETRRKMSEAAKLRGIPEETRLKMLISRKNNHSKVTLDQEEIESKT